MVVCNRCRIEMRCYKTGIVLVWDQNYCKRGDAYECPRCGSTATYVRDDVEGYHGPTLVEGDFYLEMEG